MKVIYTSLFILASALSIVSIYYLVVSPPRVGITEIQDSISICEVNYDRGQLKVIKDEMLYIEKRSATLIKTMKNYVNYVDALSKQYPQGVPNSLYSTYESIIVDYNLVLIEYKTLEPAYLRLYEKYINLYNKSHNDMRYITNLV